MSALLRFSHFTRHATMWSATVPYQVPGYQIPVHVPGRYIITSLCGATADRTGTVMTRH